MRFIAILNILIPAILYSQTEAKQKFVKENYVHLKAGATFNEVNNVLYKNLNSVGTDIFTPTKSIYYNPSVDVEFESHFSKYVGLSIDLGFMQTHQRYHYTDGSASAVVSPQKSPTYKPTGGLILSNIPHLNLAPCFYITNSTRIYMGMGLYKYYYHFDPVKIGSVGFDMNAENMVVYSHIGFCQSFDINRLRCSICVNYFGLMKTYDSGLQVGFGLVL